MKPIILRLLSLAVPGVMSVTVAAQSVMTQSISFKVKDVTASSMFMPPELRMDI